MLDLTQLSVPDLLKLSSQISEELRRRLIVRSSNNPSGDYAEWLFAKAFSWTLEATRKQDMTPEILAVSASRSNAVA